MKKILLLSVLLMQSVYAEKVLFEYDNPSKNQSVDIDGAAAIDVVTGDIKVEPLNDVFVVPSQAAVIGINATEYQVESGDTITVDWQVAYGNNCIGSVENGAASGWAGLLSSAIGNHSKNVTLNSFPTTLRITCNNLDAYVSQPLTTYKDLVISEIQDTVVVNPDIVYFRANNTSNSITINEAGPVQVTWNVSDGTSCDATSSPTVTDWNHTFNPNSSSSKSVDIAATTMLTLTCGSDSKNVQVIVDDSIPSTCNSSVYPNPNLNLKNYSYAALKDGNAFGTTTNGNVTVNISNIDFASLQFTAPSSTTFRRRLDFVSAPTNLNKTDWTSVSISTCPGDFSATAECVKHIHSGDLIKISTDPSVGGTYCKITAGQEYYLNFVNKEDPYSNSSPECLNTNDGTCAVFFSEGSL